MKVRELRARLALLGKDDAEVYVFSVLHDAESDESDDVRCHRIMEVHDGWWFDVRGGNLCIQIARNREMTQGVGTTEDNVDLMEVDVRPPGGF